MKPIQHEPAQQFIMLSNFQTYLIRWGYYLSTGCTINFRKCLNQLARTHSHLKIALAFSAISICYCYSRASINAHLFPHTFLQPYIHGEASTGRLFLNWVLKKLSFSLKITSPVRSSKNMHTSNDLVSFYRNDRKKHLICTLRNKYVLEIRSGKKIYEARANTRAFIDYLPGCMIKWHSERNAVYTRIIDRKTYNSVKEMLDEIPFWMLLPSATSRQDAIASYQDIPDYQNKVKKFGIIALKLEVLHPKNEHTYSSYSP